MSRYQFEGQNEGEEVLILFRRHKIVRKTGKLFLIFMILFGLSIVKMWVNDIWVFWAFLGFFGVGVLAYLYDYMLWYFSYFVVTNQRFRQVVQKSFFKKAVLDLSLNKIESVAYLVPDMLGSVFGYGTLIIKTNAGEMKISKVAKIEQIYDTVQKATDKNSDKVE